MINRRPLQILLEAMEIATERLGFVHGFFRLIYLHAFTPMFSRYLQGRHRRFRFVLACRHSLATGRGFNVFRSDIDYALVCFAEPPRQAVFELIADYRRLQKYFPFVGELEIYTDDEWNEKLQLEQDFPEILDLIRILRKSSWQRAILRGSPSPFHRRKTKRALRRMRDGPRRMRRYLQNLGASFPEKRGGVAVPGLSAFSHFLGWSFGTAISKNTALAISLSATDCVLLAAILPGGEDGLPDFRARIFQLRRAPQVKAPFLAVCRAEYLLCRSVKRSRAELDPKLEAWMRDLETEMSARREAPSLTSTFAES